MFSWIQLLFDTDDFPARWHCGYWSSAHGWTHIVADTMIWAAYMAIPLAIVYFLVKRRESLPMARVLWLFGLFIVSCGFGHLIEAIIFWFPVYRFAALVKVCTALISWATVLSLFPMIPKLLNLPGQASLIKRLKEENSERRKIEESLKVIVEIVNQSNDGIISLDPRGMILSWNRGAHRLYGFSPDEAIGQSVALILVDKEKSLRELLTAIEQGKEPPTFETFRRPREGDDIPVSVSISFIEDSFGRITRISMTDRDITEEKAAESKFERVVESSPNGLIMVNENGR
ncbi:MAG: PAS domain S-box protein, partial [Planctomycetota bacterium]|nr:PAS domain S-box protein [Planctomycetota bacterium]